MIVPEQSTVARLLTPSGMGAVAVIRVAGPQALDIASALFRHAKPGAPPITPSNRLHYGQWVVADEVIDDVVISLRAAENGWGCLDINCHGGVRIVERILMSLNDRGIELASAESNAALPVWPTQCLIEREVDETLLQAKTRRAVDFLLYQRNVLPDWLTEIARQALTDPLAARRRLQELTDDSRACELLIQGATVAIIGPPNAGKSTLANRLFGEARSVVSPIPGTTRDWVDEPTAIEGIPVNLIDTAGLGRPKDEIDELAMQRGELQLARADLIMVVLDTNDPWPKEFFDRHLNLLKVKRLVAVANKIDLPRQWLDDRVQAELGTVTVPVSAAAGTGLDGLSRVLADQLGLADRPDDAPGLFTPRQRQVVSSLLAEADSPGPKLSEQIMRVLIGFGAGRSAEGGV